MLHGSTLSFHYVLLVSDTCPIDKRIVLSQHTCGDAHEQSNLVRRPPTSFLAPAGGRVRGFANGKQEIKLELELEWHTSR